MSVRLVYDITENLKCGKGQPLSGLLLWESGSFVPCSTNLLLESHQGTKLSQLSPHSRREEEAYLVCVGLQLVSVWEE